MKKVIGFFALGLTAIACQAPEETNTVSSVFETNCETVRTVIDNLQNEVVSFEHYSEDFVGAQTRFNSTGDSTRLEEFKTNRLNWLEIFDAELTTPLNLLPGVNPQTNEPDGSVRYYGKWNITRDGNRFDGSKKCTHSTCTSLLILTKKERFSFSRIMVT